MDKSVLHPSHNLHESIVQGNGVLVVISLLIYVLVWMMVLGGSLVYASLRPASAVGAHRLVASTT